MKITFEIDAASMKALSKIHDLEARLEKARPAIEEGLAKHIAKVAKSDILCSMLKMAPLSPNTLRKKTDRRILVNTKNYVNSIQARRQGKGWAVYGNRKLSKLFHEGTENMPARPHLRLTMELHERQFAKVAGQLVLKEVLK